MDELIKKNDLYYISSLDDKNKTNYKQFYCNDMCELDLNFNDINGLCLKKNQYLKTIDINIFNVANNCLEDNTKPKPVNNLFYKANPNTTSKTKYNLSNISIKAPSIHTFQINKPETCEVILTFKTEGDNPLFLYICILGVPSSEKEKDITYSLFEEIGRYMMVMNKKKTDYINCKNIDSFNPFDFFPNVEQKYIPYITNNKGDDILQSNNPDKFFAVLILPDLIKIPASFQYIFKQTFYTSPDGKLDVNNEFNNLLLKKPVLRKNITYYFYQNFDKKWNNKGNIKANTQAIPKETLETYGELLNLIKPSDETKNNDNQPTNNQNDNIETNPNKNQEKKDTNEEKKDTNQKPVNSLSITSKALIIISSIIVFILLIFFIYKYFDKIKEVKNKIVTAAAAATPFIQNISQNLSKSTLNISASNLTPQKIPPTNPINNTTKTNEEIFKELENSYKNKVTELENLKKKLEENKTKLENQINTDIKELITIDSSTRIN